MAAGRSAPRRLVHTLLCATALLCLPRSTRADEVASALYVRSDTDHTVVISPRLRVAKQLSESTRVDATYSADIWTSASIDIRTSASVRPVTEQRDEINLAVAHDLGDVKLHAGYRFSSEHDYTSHGASFGGSFEFANNAAKLDANLTAFADTVGQSGNPGFARGVGTVDANLSFTQVLDPMMLIQLTYELAHSGGYQSSPYRIVGVGGTGFGCRGASLCLPERVPDQRLRHGLALLWRRALSDAISIGLTYRFYIDDWSLRSHTLLGELGWNVADGWLFVLRYRFYTQGAVSFYRPIYTSLSSMDYRTRDRELSALTYQRAGLELERQISVDDHGGRLSATLALSGNLYQYAAFIGLDHVMALEISAALLLQI